MVLYPGLSRKTTCLHVHVTDRFAVFIREPSRRGKSQALITRAAVPLYSLKTFGGTTAGFRCCFNLRTLIADFVRLSFFLNVVPSVVRSSTYSEARTLFIRQRRVTRDLSVGVLSAVLRVSHPHPLALLTTL